jgi:hypothetical protein
MSRTQARLSDAFAVSGFDIHNPKLSRSISDNSDAACQLRAQIAASS